MSGIISIRLCKPHDANALALVGQATFLETFAGPLNGADIIMHRVTHHSPAVYEAWLADSGSRISSPMPDAR